MPLMTYYLTTMAIEKHDGPVTTKDIIGFVKEILPTCADDIVFHLRELDSAGILKKELSREKKGFIWQVSVDLSPAAMKERYRGIYEKSKMFKPTYESAVKNIPTFSGDDPAHFKTLIGMIGRVTAGMKNKPGLEKMAGLVRELGGMMDFGKPLEEQVEEILKASMEREDDGGMTDQSDPGDPGKAMTYSGAGVDIFGEERAIRALAAQLTFRRSGTGAPVDLPGHFTGIIEFGDNYLSMCTDGVGTKLLVADSMEKWDTVGIDCMAMNVNDLICIGAEPLAFVDYIAIDKPTEEKLRQIGMGLNEGARQSNLSIIGGETASLGEIVKGFDLAGTCLGWVGKEKFISGQDIVPGDVIIGLESSGVHSNGFSLARKAFIDRGHCLEDNDSTRTTFGELRGKSPGAVMLEPTRIYVKEIMEVLGKFRPHGLCNITGGGLRNIGRLNRKMDYHITDPMPVQPIFRLIRELGNVDEKEMYLTFNMGMGFCIVAAPGDAGGIISSLQSAAQVVGKVTEGSGRVLFGDMVFE